MQGANRYFGKTNKFAIKYRKVTVRARLHSADDAAPRMNGMTQTLRGNDVIECWCIMKSVMTNTVVKYNKLVH